MKVYTLIFILICCGCEYTLVDIMPELKRNILNFGYRINFKYEGMLFHSFDRFYVITTFVLLMVENLKFSRISFDSSCRYLDTGINRSNYPTDYIPNLKNHCKKIIPFLLFIRNKLNTITI